MEEFIEKMRYLNLRRDDTIVLYDSFGIYSAPRMAWTLKYFGALDVKVLNGGLKKWAKEKRTIETGKIKNQKKMNLEGDYQYRIEEPHKGIVDVNTIQRLAYYSHN